MTEMVERVAKAIWPLAFEGDGAGWHQRRAVAMDQARAAIEAMRNPTAAMLFVGSNDDAGFTAVNLLASWEFMIDEALK